MATVHDVAAAVLTRLGETTTMKLQKLVYYCQCWHLARHDSPLFDEPIEAWREGPVAPALYKRHKTQLHVSSWPPGDESALDPGELSSIEWVVSSYGHFSAMQLSQMTHNELPWVMARQGVPDGVPSSEEINQKIMKDFYSRQRADVETAVTSAVASSALECVELDGEWQERLRDVASGVVSGDALVAEEIARLSNG